jgi:alkanesulfonate monooxygenase SsuD/methylene tetrahydromethanopterin reductase-like flavin-dependent oxidoreductase (luciferase family)
VKFGALIAATDLNQGRTHRELLRDVIDLAVEADRLGYDYVWLLEHELIRFIINTSALQEAVVIAERTDRIRLGSAVFVTPLYHPLLLAADIAHTDNLTGGRFEPGFGRGGSQYELRQLQVHMPEEDSRQRFREFLDVMKLAWTSDGAIEFHGRFFDFDNAYVVPRPYSDPHPPIWLASITPQSCGANAALGTDVQFAPFRKPFSLVEAAYRAFEANRTRESAQFMVNRQTYVAETMEQARRALPLIDYHEHVIGAARLDAEKVVNGVREWDEGLSLGKPYEEYMEHLPVGDPATVAEEVQKYADLGVDQYTVYTTLGQDVRLARRSLELFAEHVIPMFCDWPKTRVS